MDFNKYYLEQATGGLTAFRGPAFQRGYGFGSAFRRFMSWALPLLKQHALPLAKTVGKEVITNVASIANDAIDGKDVNDSAKEKFTTSLEKMTKQTGNGYKRKATKPKYPSKKIHLEKPKKRKKKQRTRTDVFTQNEEIV